MYVCMYALKVCMYECIYIWNVCMYVCMYVCIRQFVHRYAYTNYHIFKLLRVLLYNVYMYVSMYVCIEVCMYVCTPLDNASICGARSFFKKDFLSSADRSARGHYLHIHCSITTTCRKQPCFIRT